MGDSENSKEPLSTADKILSAAAALIIRTGSREVTVKELADEAGVSRASVHNLFKGEDGAATTGSAIYLRIIDEFMKVAQAVIATYLDALGPASSPLDRLAAVLRATMAAFRAKQDFGKVVLQQMNLSKPEEGALAAEIFRWVDQIIEEAKEKGEILRDADALESWKIRQILFVLTRGLLRSVYLGQGVPSDKTELTEKEVATEVLRVLRLYCTEKGSAKIKKVIEAVA